LSRSRISNLTYRHSWESCAPRLKDKDSNHVFRIFTLRVAYRLRIIEDTLYGFRMRTVSVTRGCRGVVEAPLELPLASAFDAVRKPLRQSN